VTADYDATVKMHTFSDFKLKFVEQKIEDGAILMHGCAVSSTNVGEGAVLRRGSVTWKGQTLESGKIYEGTPAEAIDDLEAGIAISGVAAPTLLGRLRGPASFTAGNQK
jgi:hypothetical protein